MNFRKFATLILLAVILFSFGKYSATVQAEEIPQTSETATKEAVTTKSSGKKVNKAVQQEKKKYTASELRLMAAIINCEAGAEGYQGKMAVGIVVMNRVKAKHFPNTIRKVIYQRGQFSPVRNGAMRKRLAQYDAGKTKSKQWRDCIRAAKSVLEGRNYITYRGNKKSMKGYYFFSVSLAGARMRLGGHRFK